MTEAVDDSQDDFYSSSSYFLDAKANADFAEFSNDKATADPNTLTAQSFQSSPQDSSGESQRSSLDSSDGSSADAIIDERERAPGRIPIPTGPSDHSTINGIGTHMSRSHDDPMIGNDFFDFDSAASSPSHVSRENASQPIRMPIRSAPTHGMPAFGYGPFSSAYSRRISVEGSPLSIASSTRRHLHSRHSSESQAQYIHGSLLDMQSQNLRNVHSPIQPITSAQKDPTPSEKASISPTLHINNLPKTQRVETQMHMRLTMWPLPEGVSTLHFQGYTMARTKLVMKPPPEKSPSMLELYAHCVCASAMEDERKLKEALIRAADTAGKDDSANEDGKSSPRRLKMSDEDPRKPTNGGFVFICDQCIRRETKRIGRKKLKNNEQEESWLEAQPKRIIVFNKAEIIDWQPWSSYQDDDDTEEGRVRVPPGNSQFPENAMQIRFPMRIQCYSRHHEEKLGYKVIFTIKDWKNRLVAQTITNAAIITDDHKAQQASRNGSQTQAVNYFEIPSLPGAGVFASEAANGNNGLSLFSRNSFSTPDLQSFQHSQYHQMPQQYRPFSSFGGQPQTGPAVATSRNVSRPASPSTPLESRNKRRKGSISGRIRADLAMTKINPTSTASPPVFGGPASGPNISAGFGGHLPFSPNYPPAHGLSTPPSSAHMNNRPPAPSAFNYNLHQRSQSVEDLQSHQSLFSAPTSAYQSQVASPDSSPQPLSQPQIHSHGLTNSVLYLPRIANPGCGPNVHKVTPAEGPKAGGIEVTCLGEGFRPDSVVTFGDLAATTTSLYSDKALLCRLPPAAQAGPVRVTVSNNNEHSMPSPSPNEVLFRYIDNDEQEMIRHALQVLTQQFSGGIAEAHEFARHILASVGKNSSFNDGTSTCNTQQRQTSSTREWSTPFESLEDVVLRCLELVDLDDNPNEVNLNYHGANGHGILHAAASLGYYRLVAGLLARGGNPDLRDNNGMTPTHMACLNGHVRIVRKLCSAGADSRIRSLNGICPADLASSSWVRKAVEGFGFGSGSKSGGTTPCSHLSRASSTMSAGSYWSMNQNIISNGVQCRAKLPLHDGEEPLHYRSQPPTPVQVCSRSRRGSLGPSTHATKGATGVELHKDAEVFAVSPAMSAWRDQISAQIQQLQQSVHRALPPIPNLPDYQAYPVVRRISSLVPQRNPRVDATDTSNVKFKEADYRWWELITGTVSSPPAYEEIYPQEKQEHVVPKTIPASRKMREAVVDQKCETVYGQSESASIMSTVYMSRNRLTKAQQQELRNAHARKVKRLRSDRTLFFFWVGIRRKTQQPYMVFKANKYQIPLLLLFIIVMIRDQALHIWEIACHAASKYKCWKITGAFPWGGIIFTAGFIVREVSVYNTRDLALFITTQVLVIAAPPVYSLVNYMILSRILYYVPYYSPMHPGRVLTTFLGLDIVVEVLTGQGAARLANLDSTPAERKVGEALVRASLLLQVALFVLFITLELVFHARCIRGRITPRNLTAILALLYASSLLILTRNVYRVIEVWHGYAGYLARHEAFFYVFDAALMLVNSLAMNVWHPAVFLPRNFRVYLAPDGVREKVGPGWDDARPWWVTVLDPFDVVGLFSKKTREERRRKFWEDDNDDQQAHHHDRGCG
ncbi:MAG: hypothetical protein Q9163_003226 [Psora crenata]